MVFCRYPLTLAFVLELPSHYYNHQNSIKLTPVLLVYPCPSFNRLKYCSLCSDEQFKPVTVVGSIIISYGGKYHNN